jgi:polar amino acid transport system ATP-binding protein
MINGKSLSLKHKNNLILNNITFALEPGRITLFIGPSGAGKTSLLQCIANLNTHYTGTITADGIAIKTLSAKARAHTVGFIFQHFNLFPHMSALENCMHPLITVMGMSNIDAQSKALNKLALVHMQEHSQKKPHQLSGGQQQRIAIARALCLEPKVLLCDEPTSALDPISSKQLALLLKELKAQGIAIGISSHDMGFVRALMDYVYLLENGCIIETLDIKHEALDQKRQLQAFLDHTID